MRGEKTMSIDPKALVLGWTDALNRGDADAAAAYVTEDCVLTNIGTGYAAQQTCACLFISKRPLERCRLDLRLVRERSVAMYCAILLRTLPEVFSGENSW
jgi:ketosteroid isomerase-like protein